MNSRANGRARTRRNAGAAALAVLATLASVLTPSAPAAAVESVDPAGPTDFRVEEVTRFLTKPTSMNFAPDGRLFVTEKEGTLRIIEDGAPLPTPALAIAVNSFRERGMLSVEFDPDFATNGWIYLYYTSDVGGCHNRVSRFTMAGDVADPASELLLLNIGPCGSGGHNAGAVHLASDGTLFIDVGDQNIGANAQSMANLFGKILRINRDGSIPADNPFFATATGKNRAIFALGFRNPFTAGVDPVTGDLFVNDVGGFDWEEVNWVKAGQNHGWPTTEGDFDQATYPNFTRPVYAYAHGDGEFEGCAVVGGTFYRPGTSTFPTAYHGDWFFADYCGNWVHVLDRATGAVSSFGVNMPLIADLDVGPDGALYYLDRAGGTQGSFVRRIEFSNLPGISKQPADLTVDPGGSATFRITPSGNRPYTFQWKRNGTPIAGATGRAFTFTATASNNGDVYSVDLGNANGTVTSRGAVLTVRTIADSPPSASITSPAPGTTYTGGATIAFAGTGTDTEDGALPASAYTWEVIFHHADHIHPFIEPFSGVTSGSFPVPDNDETATDVFYRIHLTVTDSSGQSTEVTRDIVPVVQKIGLATSPDGLPLAINGNPTPTPIKFDSVVGVKQRLQAPLTQAARGTTWAFDTWLDATPPERIVRTDARQKTYTAVYRVDGGSVGSGTGLPGTYYDNDNFTGATKTRLDRALAFAWKNAAPVGGIAPSSYSAVWVGTLLPQFSESTQLIVRTNAALKLYLGPTLLIDSPATSSPTDRSVSVPMTAGAMRDLRIEASFPGTIGHLRFDWASASIPRSLVPRSQLSS